MHWIDWGIILLAIAIPLYIGFRTKAYVKGVADFLSSGRVAGRYVLAVSSGEAAMGLISLAAMFEQYYQSAFAYSLWGRDIHRGRARHPRLHAARSRGHGY